MANCTVKKNTKKTSWNMKKNMHVPKETVNHEKNRDEQVNVDESNDNNDDSYDKEELEVSQILMEMIVRMKMIRLNIKIKRKTKQSIPLR